MEFGYTEDRIDETFEAKFRREEALRDTLYGNALGSVTRVPMKNKLSKEERNKLKIERIMKKREELMKLANKKRAFSPILLNEMIHSR